MRVFIHVAQKQHYSSHSAPQPYSNNSVFKCVGCRYDVVGV